jgi:hypothetical protein
MLRQSIFIVSSTALGIGGAKHDGFYPYGKAYGQVFREQGIEPGFPVTMSPRERPHGRPF